MKRISLLLMAVIGCQAADVAYPAPITSAQTVVITSTDAAPTTVTTGQVKIGGGAVLASGMVNTSKNMNAAGYGLNTVGTTSGDYRALGRTSASAIILRSYSSNEGGNGNLVLASADNNGIYEFLTVLGGSGPFGIFQGNDPGSTVNGQVRIGGGIIRTAGDAFIGGRIYVAKNALETDFLVGDNSVGRRVELGTNSSGNGQFRLRDTAGNIVVNMIAGQSSVIGTDPGGSELLRVGGGAKFGNLITSASATQPGLLATCSSPSGFSTLILGNTGASGRQFTIGLGGNTSGQNGLLYFYDNTALATRGYIKPDGSFIWGSDPNPGGNELLRVGGNGTSGGIITSGSVNCNTVHAAVLYGGEKGVTARHLVMGFNALGTATHAIQPVHEGVGYANLSLNELGGAVTIGNFAGVTQAASTKLAVNGTITAKEIKVTTSGADYVFENDYKLRSLAEVEAFIAEHKHLPEMMSAKAMQADGMPVSEVVTKQLAKIEELTLYAIAAQKERDEAKEQLRAQEGRIQRLEAALQKLTDVATP